MKKNINFYLFIYLTILFLFSIFFSYQKHDVSKYNEKYVKLIVVNKKDLYQFDMFVDRLLKADAYEVKIIEDFSDLYAKNV